MIVTEGRGGMDVFLDMDEPDLIEFAKVNKEIQDEREARRKSKG